MIADAATPPDCSVLIISFNTLELTRECLRNVYGESAGLTTEIIVVDNASRDGSADMIAAEFPDVILLRSMVNLGFGNANNLAMERAMGRYWLLLNTDAFFHAGSLRLALEHMEATPQCGVGGGMQVGRDGTPQHASHAFHSVWNDASVLSGLAHKFPRSPWFAQLDRTHTDLSRPAEVDWITGAFLILRPQAIVTRRQLRPIVLPLLRGGGPVQARQGCGLAGVLLAGRRRHTPWWRVVAHREDAGIFRGCRTGHAVAHAQHLSVLPQTPRP